MILTGISPEQSSLQESIIDGLLLPITDWRALGQTFLHQLPTGIIVFAITDPLVGAIYQAPLDEDELTPVEYDIYGLSSYGRCILYAHYLARHLGAQLFVADDGSAKRVDVLLELITAGQVCQKYLQGHLPFGIWDGCKHETANEIAYREAIDISQSILKNLLKQSSHLSLTLEPSPQWLTATNGQNKSTQPLNVIQSLVQASLNRAAQDIENLYYAETFKLVCRSVLTGKSDDKFVEAWINLAVTSDREGKR
jgi:hypothetical protein